MIDLPDFFAETLRETLDEWDVSQAKVSHMTELQRKWCRHPACILQSQRKCTQIRPLSLSQAPSSPGFWLRLQLDDDLMRAERENDERIQREVQPHAA